MAHRLNVGVGNFIGLSGLSWNSIRKLFQKNTPKPAINSKPMVLGNKFLFIFMRFNYNLTT